MAFDVGSELGAACRVTLGHVKTGKADWIAGPFFVFVISDVGEQRLQKIVRLLQLFDIVQNALL